jgi:histidine triad (HIT) family protein
LTDVADCIFCKIVNGKMPADIVYQDERVAVFRDIHPKAPVHVLIVPRKHIVSLAELASEDLPIAAHMLEIANVVADREGAGSSYKLVVNTGKQAGQVVMHLHMHLLAGKKLLGPV